MTIKPYDAYQIACILQGQSLNGELDPMSAEFKPVASYLSELSTKSRMLAWRSMLVVMPDPDKVARAVENQDLSKPAPDADEPIQYATLADIRRISTVKGWTWNGWIPSSRLVGLASLEGVGKTRTMMDLHKRVFLNLPWPDGQKMTLPKGSPAIWICADGQHEEMIDLAKEYGLPDESVILPAPCDEPYDNTSLDEDETFNHLRAVIAARKPWVLCIDSLTYATTANLCEQRTIALLKPKLVDIIQKYHINVILLLHVSASGQAYGKRIKGITRTLMHLECPDPEASGRLRLWVEKSYGKKPPALGVTMGDHGNAYDANPPPPSQFPSSSRLRDEGKCDAAIKFIKQELSKGDCLTVEMLKQWESKDGSKGSFFRARDRLKEDGLISEDDSRTPKMCHLNHV